MAPSLLRALATGLVIAMVSFGADAGDGARTPHAPFIAGLLRTPLIVGASVSNDFAAPSPGKILALRFTAADSIRKVARNGAKATATVPLLNDEILAGRSLIIAIDLLFWDSASTEIDGSLAALDTLIAKSRALNLPLVLGDIPALHGRQPGRDALNQALRERCRPEAGCLILSLDELFRDLSDDGVLIHGGRTYRRGDLFRPFDPVHPNSTGSSILADRLGVLLGRLEESREKIR